MRIFQDNDSCFHSFSFKRFAFLSHLVYKLKFFTLEKCYALEKRLEDLSTRSFEIYTRYPVYPVTEKSTRYRRVPQQENRWSETDICNYKPRLTDVRIAEGLNRHFTHPWRERLSVLAGCTEVTDMLH